MPAKSSGSDERQLDPEEHVALAHAHPARRLDDVAVDLVDGHVGVRQHRRHREHDERDHHVREADAEDGDADRDHGRGSAGRGRCSRR